MILDFFKEFFQKTRLSSVLVRLGRVLSSLTTTTSYQKELASRPLGLQPFCEPILPGLTSINKQVFQLRKQPRNRYVYIHIYIVIYVYIVVYIYTYMYIYISIYIYMYIYIYAYMKVSSGVHQGLPALPGPARASGPAAPYAAESDVPRLVYRRSPKFDWVAATELEVNIIPKPYYIIYYISIVWQFTHHSFYSISIVWQFRLRLFMAKAYGGVDGILNEGLPGFVCCQASWYITVETRNLRYGCFWGPFNGASGSFEGAWG